MIVRHCVMYVCDCITGTVIHLLVNLKLQQQMLRGLDLATQVTQAPVLLMSFKTSLNLVGLRLVGVIANPFAIVIYLIV